MKRFFDISDLSYFHKIFFYLKLQNCITFLQQWTIYGLNALTRDHVNNFWDTSTPIHQTKSLVGTYTGPDAGRMNNYMCGLLRPYSYDKFNPHYKIRVHIKMNTIKNLSHIF